MVSGPLRAAPAIFCAELSGAEGEYLPVLPSGVAIFGPRYVACGTRYISRGVMAIRLI
jgi:hypothetical protein